MVWIKWSVEMKFYPKASALVFALFFLTQANAQQWTFQGGKQTNNGSVSVKSVDGSTSQSTT